MLVFPATVLFFQRHCYFSSDSVSFSSDNVIFPATVLCFSSDSDPADEQRECENKAVALAHAIDLAESSFVDN